MNNELKSWVLLKENRLESFSKKVFDLFEELEICELADLLDLDTDEDFALQNKKLKFLTNDKKKKYCKNILNDKF